MKKGLIRKGLAFIVIVLFISVGVQPIFAGESINTTLDTDEDCIECEEIDGILELDVLKEKTNRELQNKIAILTEINKDLITNLPSDDNPIICVSLYLRHTQLTAVYLLFMTLSVYYQNNPIISNLYLQLMLIYFDRTLYIEELMVVYNCDYYPWD